MKIVRIFGDKLFAFHFDGNEENCLDTIVSDWNDVAYLYQFVTENRTDIPGKASVAAWVAILLANAADLDEWMHAIATNPNGNWNDFFKPLHNHEYG